MYGLRHINNMYSEFAGQRSDFIIMGHPEYNLGKVRCQKLGDEWDQRRRVKPARSIVAQNVFAIKSSADICTSGLYMKPLKERAMERSRPGPKDTPPSMASLNGFLTALDADSGHPLPLAKSLSAPALPINAANDWTQQCHSHIVESASDNHMNSVVSRHYKGLRTGLSDLKSRMKANPEKTKQELASSGAWRYYAPLLEKPRGGSSGGGNRSHASLDKWLTHHNTLPGIKPGPGLGD